MIDQKKAFLYAIFTVFFWSTVASAFKVSLKYLDFIHLLFYSSFVSTFTLFLVLLFQQKLPLLKKSSPEELLRSALLGLLNPFFYYSILLKAYSLLPAQIAQPLNYTWPIMIVLFSIPLLKQKIRLWSILAVFISFTGIIVISSKGFDFQFRAFEPKGIFLAMGSSIIWALFWIFNMKDKRDEVVKLFLNFFFGVFFIGVAISVFSKIKMPQLLGLLGATYVGIFEMGITFVLWLRALHFSRTTAQVSNLIYLSPFLSLVFIRLIVGEKIYLSTLVGLVLIIGGIFIQEIGRYSQEDGILQP